MFIKWKDEMLQTNWLVTVMQSAFTIVSILKSYQSVSMTTLLLK